MGRFLSVMGSCDRCSRTETCTSAAVICENLDYRFQFLSPETLQNTFWAIYLGVMKLHQLHQNIPRMFREMRSSDITYRSYHRSCSGVTFKRHSSHILRFEYDVYFVRRQGNSLMVMSRHLDMMSMTLTTSNPNYFCTCPNLGRL